MLTEQDVMARLQSVIDPETGISIVDMGLIYSAGVDPSPHQPHGKVHILYTLTTPACPLSETIFQSMNDVFSGLSGFDPVRDITLELTFDPPWTIDRLSEEAKAELGF